jgi:hypothetical protein
MELFNYIDNNPFIPIAVAAGAAIIYCLYKYFNDDNLGNPPMLGI